MAATIDDRVAELERANAELLRQLDACSAELNEARDQQTATAEVLQVINSSPGDLAPVFDAMLERALRLCGAAYGNLLSYDGESFHPVAVRGDPRLTDWLPRHGSFRAGPGTTNYRILEGEPVVHVADAIDDEPYRQSDPIRRALVEIGQCRALLSVALRKDDVLLGVIHVYRIEPQPFTDKQIALLQNFAAQAVIAIENARLLTETREALDQQTATSEVLQVINSSPGDLAPVFDAMLEKATELCDAPVGTLWLFDGEHINPVATRGAPERLADFLHRGPHKPNPVQQRQLRGEGTIHLADLKGTTLYRDGDTLARAVADLGDIQTVLSVPLRREDQVLGLFGVYRQEARPFSDKQIALIDNFAAQAVIAMENARLITETREALEQRTATAEVLQVINSSPGDLAPVFDAMLEKALHLCEAPYGILWNYDGEFFEVAAQRGVPKAFLDTMSGPQRPTSPETTRGRLVAGEHVVHIANLGADLLYQSGDPHRRALVDAAGAQVVVAVSLRKDDKLLGAFTIYRQEARPFTDKQIALVTTFADQAVIAMENARLLTETREALEQQTATAEVLQVINSSPGDLAPVFDAMLEKAMRLCEAAFGVLWAYEGNRYRAAAVRGAPLAFVEFLRQPLLPHYDPGSGLERALRGEDLVINDDMAAEEIYRHGDPLRRAIVDVGGARSHILVALRKDETLLGAITIYRQEVRPFTDKQIALLQNFAAQAVIAMENARLITETREALAQQTATAEVLQVINSSPGDLAPVFDAMLEKAHSLCDATYGSLQLWDRENFRGVAMRGFSDAMVEALQRGYSPGPNHPCRALLDGKHIAHCADMAAVDDPVTREGAKLSGIRTVLYVALLKDNALLGQIVAGRHEVRPFTEKEIALVENFAAQAVIAMENARLLTETREALDQQTATAEVLQVINSSPGDLAPVFDAMLGKATRLCEAPFGILRTWDGERLHFGAVHGDPQFSDWVRQRGPIRPDSDRSPMGRILAGERVVSVADAPGDEGYRTSAGWREMVEASGVRSAIWVALHKDDALLGYITVYRQEVRPFTDKQIALLQNFAAQAVIAMENARLITETREALAQQTATAEVLQVINSSPGDLSPVFDAMLDKALRLCDAAFGLLHTYDGERFRALAISGLSGATAEALREWIPDPGSALERIARGDRVVHISNVIDTEAYWSGVGSRRRLVELTGARTALWVALRKDDAPVGAFVIYRKEVRPFTDKQIALVQNFAAQAVIAMENARLITETREALEQQTATAEVLQVINSSPGDLAPVFEAMLEKATNLCDAPVGTLWLFDGEHINPVATRGAPERLADFLHRGPHKPNPVQQRQLRGEGTIHLADLKATTLYRAGDTLARAVADLGGIQTVLSVPLRREDRVLGLFGVYRQETRPFSEKQIALIDNFAAQAVIAMENARLITETREALAQQTATAEVLQVINSSPGDLAPVFDAMLEKAVRLCDFAFAALWIYDGTAFHPVALHGMPAAFEAYLREHTPPAFKLLHDSAGPIHFPDVMATEMPQLDPEFARAAQQLGSVRTLLLVPLRKDAGLLGAFVAYRQEVRPFSDKQIALLQNFAAQAVIAMENARLLTETREALEQQTATAEVLQVINSSPGDLAPVFDAMLEKAVRLCEAPFGTLRTWDGERFHFGAVYGDPKLSDWVRRRGSFHPDGGSSPLRRIIEGEQIVQVADASNDPGSSTSPAFREMVEASGMRRVITVALRKDEALLGTIQVYRQEVRPFTDKQVALLQNFAAQAVIAMENARLLTETRAALEQQTATAEVLQVINSSPGDLAPVFDAILEKAHSLCGIDRGALQLYDGEYFRAVATHGLPEALAAIVREPNRPDPGELRARLLAGARFAHAPDLAQSDGYRAGAPSARAVVDIGGVRSVLWVPLRKDGVLLGAISAARTEVKPFSDREMSLLENFAAQAVIAMENARLITETREALEQQTATAEVLQVINSSPGDLAPVFDAMLDRATRLCDAALGVLSIITDGQSVRHVAFSGSAEVAEYLKSSLPERPGPGTTMARLIAGENCVQVLDASSDDVYRQGDPGRRAMVDLAKARTIVGIALRNDRELLGTITLYRQEVRPFAEREIALLQNFAAQAVIAMQNARLLTETREALEQQTATAEVLQVINSSPGDLALVFDAMLDKAMRLCGAAFGQLHTYDGEGFPTAALRGLPAAYAEYQAKNPPTYGPGTAPWRIVHGEHVVHLVDLANSEAYRAGDAARRATVDLGGCLTLLTVALRRESTLLGTVSLYRQEVRPFSDKQIALLQNFAAQAVIAMENARLLGELRQRTGDLEESLEYQTATSDVLKVISQSTFDLEPVLQTVLDTAMRLCGNTQGLIFRREEDGVYRLAVGSGAEPEYVAREAGQAIRPGPDTLVGRTVLAGRPVQIIDAMSDPDYALKEEARVGKLRTMLGVPLLREGVPIGVICTARPTVEPFTEKQIALVTTFADQAVIAIENARLLNELRERTAELGRSVEELKMLSEVGRAVSSTLDLRAVLSTILTASLGMTWATAGAIFRYIRAERAFRLVEAVGWDEALLGSVGDLSIAETETLMSEAALQRTPIQLTDLAELPSTPLRDASLAAGLRSVLIVPLVGAERIFGALVLQRREAGEFPAETVRLMQTLASQSVLAIQNARLFREIADKSEQLALASEHKSQFLANMSHELRTPLNAILGYAELLVDGIYGVLPEKAQGVLERVQNNGKHLLALINDVLDLAKIEAGQLALTLEDYVLAEVVRSVVTATEPLAAAKGLKFTAIIQDGMPMAHGDARRVSQVLLNLAGNAIKFTDAGEVEINASAAGGQFVLTVRDTGPGIADADQERIFGEFQQIENTDTRKKGGTGLGLAISKRMVEMQGGMISVESTLGRGSTFRVVLPVRVEPAMEEAAE